MGHTERCWVLFPCTHIYAPYPSPEAANLNWIHFLAYVDNERLLEAGRPGWTEHPEGVGRESGDLMCTFIPIYFHSSTSWVTYLLPPSFWAIASKCPSLCTSQQLKKLICLRCTDQWRYLLLSPSVQLQFLADGIWGFQLDVLGINTLRDVLKPGSWASSEVGLSCLLYAILGPFHWFFKF